MLLTVVVCLDVQFALPPQFAPNVNQDSHSVQQAVLTVDNNQTVKVVLPQMFVEYVTQDTY